MGCANIKSFSRKERTSASSHSTQKHQTQQTNVFRKYCKLHLKVINEVPPEHESSATYN